MATRQQTAPQKRPPAAEALAQCRPHFLGVAVFSAFINILMLTGSLYMLQVYDRVLSSRSIPTLVGLSLIVLAAYILQGGLDSLRSKMLIRIGARFDELLSRRAYDVTMLIPLRGGRPEQALQPVRDIDQIRGFLSGMGPTALFDLPWLPIFFIGAYVLHPWLGALVLVGGTAIVGLTLLTEAKSREPTRAMLASGLDRQVLIDTTRRSAEAIQALGMLGAFRRRWGAVNARHVHDGIDAVGAAGTIGAVAKIFRMALQSAVLGLGAYLVIRGELSGGSMIAASILTSRALAPVEIAVANWKGFIAARQGYRRLNDVLRLTGEREAPMALPAPRLSLSLDDVYVGAPGVQTPIVSAASFTLKAGQALGVIGPSGSGKSTLARAIVGIRPLLRGAIRVDGATLDQWDADQLGRHIGYLPQDVQLFEGTIAENIARFDAASTPEKIVAAAKAAGAHDLILKLSDGYDTRVSDVGEVLSGGQRQRVALARALYGDPFLVVLDEPNSSLDAEGELALREAIKAICARGCIAIIVTHRPSAIAGVDMVAVMHAGRVVSIAPREEVLEGVMRSGGSSTVRTLAAVG